MRSFPNAVTEAAREITAETIAALREETRVDGAPQRKNFAKQQLRFAMQAGDEHNKCRTTRCAATRRRKVMTRQQGEAVAHDDGGRMDEGDAFAKVAAKKKSCRERRSGFVLLESLPVIRAIRWAISFALVIDSGTSFEYLFQNSSQHPRNLRMFLLRTKSTSAKNAAF